MGNLLAWAWLRLSSWGTGKVISEIVPTSHCGSSSFMKPLGLPFQALENSLTPRQASLNPPLGPSVCFALHSVSFYCSCLWIDLKLPLVLETVFEV